MRMQTQNIPDLNRYIPEVSEDNIIESSAVEIDDIPEETPIDTEEETPVEYDIEDKEESYEPKKITHKVSYDKNEEVSEDLLDEY